MQGNEPSQPNQNSTTPTSTPNPATPPPTQPSLQRPVVTPPPKKTKKTPLLVVLGLLVAAALAAGALWYLRKDTSDSAAKTKIEDIDQLDIGTIEGPLSLFPESELAGPYFSLNRQVFEGLVGNDNNKFVPLLAESWTNPDENTWNFKLKSGVKFHTGKTLTAADVKANIEALQKEEYWSLFTRTIKSVAVVSDNEVKLTTTQPDALLLNRLSLAWMRDLSAPKNAVSTGTGAYQFDSAAKPTENVVTLKAFDGYHGERAKTRALTYNVYESDTDLVTALKQGKLDIIDTIESEAVDKEVKALGYKAVEYQAPGSFGLYMNMVNSEALKKKDVREAIALALNREEVITKSKSTNQPTTDVVPKTIPGYDASATYPAYNLEKAKAALAKSGSADVTLTFAYFKDVQVEPPVMIEQLKAAGFKVTEKPYTDPGMLSTDLSAGKFDLFAAVYSSDLFDGRDVFGGILGGTVGGGERESSYPVLNDKKFDDLLAQSDKEFDPVKRTAVLQQANRYIAENLLWIPIRNTNYVTYIPSDVAVKIDYNGGSTLGVYYRTVGRVVAVTEE